MAEEWRWYYVRGPSDNALANVAGEQSLGTSLATVETGAHGHVVGIRYEASLLSSVPNLDAAMQTIGLFPLTDPTTEPTGIYARVTTLEAAAPLAPVSEYLSSAGSAIPTASGWQSVIDAEIVVPAGGSLEIDFEAIFDMPVAAIGGQVRFVLNDGGGNVVLATKTLPAVSAGADRPFRYRAAGLSAGTYTAIIQAQATVAILGSVTAQPGTGMILKAAAAPA